jgi:hypothetical protein
MWKVYTRTTSATDFFVSFSSSSHDRVEKPGKFSNFEGIFSQIIQVFPFRHSQKWDLDQALFLNYGLSLSRLSLETREKIHCGKI